MLLPRKIYLDGFDWIANFLNYQSRLTPGEGNHFILNLELPDCMTDANVEKLLRPLTPHLALLCGSIRRQFLNLAPYWKPGIPEPIPVTGENLTFDSDFIHAAETFANRPLPSHRAIAVHRIGRKNGTVLLFKFSHLLFDGRGAELLLEAIRSKNSDILPEGGPGMPSPMLDEWEKQFSCGRQVQNRLLAISKAGSVFAKGANGSAASAFRVISLSEAQTDSLCRRSDREAGPFMLTSFLLSLSAYLYRKHLACDAPGNFLVPMSIDMRGQDGVPHDAVFFNRWSLLPVLIGEESQREISKLVAEIRKQIFVNTGERIAMAYRAATRLTRIAPPALLLGIVKKMGNPTRGTFMFSFISGSSLETNHFAGQPLTNLYHIPSMPPMTGFGVFFNMFNNRLNCVVSYRAGVFSEAEIERFVSELEKNLKECE